MTSPRKQQTPCIAAEADIENLKHALVEHPGLARRIAFHVGDAAVGSVNTDYVPEVAAVSVNAALEAHEALWLLRADELDNLDYFTADFVATALKHSERFHD